MSIARTIVLALCATLAAPGAASAAPTVAELAKDRVAAAEKAFQAASAAHRAGRTTVDAVYVWSVRWLDATLDASPRTAKQGLADHARRMTELEAEAQRMAAAGTASKADADATAYYRIEATLWSTRGKK